MLRFLSEGISLSYIDENSEAKRFLPILLIHGFASHVDMNWISTGWVKHLVDAGYRVLALDNRGHGKSDKLYDPALYSTEIMANDAYNLLNHLKISKAHVVGYSMGARVAAVLALEHPYRVGKLILGGLGFNMVRCMAGTGPIAQALLAPHIDDVLNPTARTFRAFAEQTKSDLKALAVCIRKIREPISRERIAELKVPVLVAVGTKDVMAGSAQLLAKLIPHAKSFEILENDHIKAAGASAFKEAALSFLSEGDALALVGNLQ